MSDPHGRVGRVHALAAGAGGAERLDPEVLGVDRDLHLFCLGEDDDRRRRGVDSPGRFGGRDALHPVNARLVAKHAVGIVPFHSEHDLFEPAEGGGVAVQDGDLEASLLRIASVHPEQVSGEQARLLSPRSSADLDDRRLLVVRVWGDEQVHQLAFDRLEAPSILGQGLGDLGFPDIATHDCLREFRYFVRNGIRQSGFLRYCYYAPISDLIEPLFEPSVFSHKLVVSYHDAYKSLILSAQFVDTMPWLIVIDNINLHSSSVSLLHKKALIGGYDQTFIEHRAVLSPKAIEWRTFSTRTRDAVNFSRIKFLQSYLHQHGRAVYERDMRSDECISETLCNRVEKYQGSESHPEVKAITEVIEIRYCKSRYIDNIKKQTYKMALSLWEDKQPNNRKKREKTLDIYRDCLKYVANNYGMPETIGEQN